ncbi:MAG: hypothetical protein WCJ59_00055 [bacterium]
MTVILFIGSLILLLAFLGVKFFEMRKERETVVSKKMKQADKPIEGFIKHLKREISYINRRNAKLFGIFVWRLVYDKLWETKKKLDSKQSKFFVAVTGEKHLRKSQHVSGFLKTISKNKIESKK